MGSQLKRLTMYSKVKNLFEKGLSISQISRTTKLDRKTVRKYLHMNEQDFQDHLSSMASRHHKLEEYEEFVRHRIEQCPDCSAAQVEDWLKEQYPAMDPISSRTVYAFVQKVRQTHHLPKPGKTWRQYHPVEQLPYGKQAQVDFGESWMQTIEDKRVKVYFMVTILSRSRQKAVQFTLQPVTTCFAIAAHEQAFKAFQGIPETVVYDQDSVLVKQENHGAILYTDAFKQYLLHRKFTPHVCRKADPESKGKVEAGVKYVKYNFLRGRRFSSLEVLQQEADDWLQRTANAKKHATAHLVPHAEWLIEKPYLKPYLPLPTSAQVVAGRPYHVRRDNTVSYRGCFYSLPLGTYQGPNTTVQLEVDDRQLLLSDASGSLLARHELSYRKGVTQVNNHHRRDISQSVMQLQEALIGKFSDQAQARLFINSIYQRYPRYSRDQYDHKTVNGISKTQLQELRQLVWLDQTYNMLLVGPSGTGKTFLAGGLCYEAIKQGYTGLFRRMDDLIQTIKLKDITTSAAREYKRLQKAQLLVIDDIMMFPLKKMSRSACSNLSTSCMSRHPLSLPPTRTRKSGQRCLVMRYWQPHCLIGYSTAQR